MVDLRTEFCGIDFKNPLLAASGCYGFGLEMQQLFDNSIWGGICSKGLTLEERMGNPAPRVVETASGMLNSVGLQNPGIDHFLQNELQEMLGFNTVIIANVAGQSIAEYVRLCAKLEASGVQAIELNLSCPNVKTGCMALGTNAALITETVRQCKAVSSVPLIAKLSPNVSDISCMAQAAEAGGADAVSLVNTFLGLVVDLSSRRPVLRNNTGGLSGPAIKPLALRMVADVYRSVKIPIVGLGGISCGKDALEFIMAGAQLVQLGMINFSEPSSIFRIIAEMQACLEELQIKSLAELRGSLAYWA